ncbi:Uncharacterised protein [Neisseria gonorrhoeae]|uniref:Uncharacterized protein n=1 Tax=Neisseria gonorrhoeae TaxID=485 RepID=A0A378W1L7_NEIGO|nr:Uncharacterised protein [Neisseria gonorrhoeae]
MKISMSNHKICSDLKQNVIKPNSKNTTRPPAYGQSPVRRHTLQMAVFQQNNANTQKYGTKMSIRTLKRLPSSLLLGLCLSLPSAHLLPTTTF